MDPLKHAVPPTPTFAVANGFTLIELAVVLFIVSLLIGGMLMPLSAQRDVRALAETEKILNEAREQVLGFATLHQRLPCPASETSQGVELFCSNDTGTCTETTLYPNHGRCARPYDGFLPAVSLGFQPITQEGLAADGWGDSTSNRMRYAVTDFSYTPLTATTHCQPGGVAGTTAFRPYTCTEGIRDIYAQFADSADLSICNAGGVITNPGTATADCPTANRLATDAALVIYSLGKNATTTGGASADENHNRNPRSTIVADRVFVRAITSPTFDDQILWASRSMVFGRMLAAGRLP